MKQNKTLNKVIWVWSEFFPAGLVDDTPEKLQRYLDDGWLIQETHVTTYRQNKSSNIPAPVYCFILRKEQNETK